MWTGHCIIRIIQEIVVTAISRDFETGTNINLVLKNDHWTDQRLQYYLVSVQTKIVRNRVKVVLAKAYSRQNLKSEIFNISKELIL